MKAKTKRFLEKMWNWFFASFMTIVILSATLFVIGYYIYENTKDIM